MIIRILKIILGIALIPFCIGFTWQLGETLFSITYNADAAYCFIAGSLLYVMIHLLFKKPIFAYVMGHELTHALFALLFGGSVKSFQASDRGGRVIVTKSNFMITLAPYFFPLYTFVTLIAYGIAGSTEAHHTLISAIIVMGGATFMFHLVLTFIFLNTDQHDIAEQGAFFSYPLIYLFNILFFILLIDIFMSRNLDYLDYFIHGIIKSVYLFKMLGIKVASLFYRV